ncbi:MFS transporter [Sphingomonas sp.]|uniref:MFS transporter n=1 Tax=Sphingomonas sp. TaxID=28214 RepID=UPI0031D7C72F
MFETFTCSMAMMTFASLAGPIARITGMVPWQMGIVVTLAGVAWMLTARIWGRLSDRHGRRPVILIGVAGFAVSYLALGVFVHVAVVKALSPVIVFAGLLVTRGLAGVFYAAVPATSAALVADHVPIAQRPKAMATLGAAGALGIVIGPASVGLLVEGGLVPPLLLVAVLPMIGWLILWRVLPAHERHAPSGQSTLGLLDPRLRHAMVTAFLSMCGVTIAQVIVGFYAIDRLMLSPTDGARIAGMALACVGIALIVAQLVMRRLDWPTSRLMGIGMLVGAAGFAGAGLAASAVQLCLGYAIAAFGMGWVFPSVTALATSVVPAEEQGAAAGTVSAAQGMAVVIGPLLGTAVYAIDPRAPFALIAITFATAMIGTMRRSPIMTSFTA